MLILTQQSNSRGSEGEECKLVNVVNVKKRHDDTVLTTTEALRLVCNSSIISFRAFTLHCGL